MTQFNIIVVLFLIFSLSSDFLPIFAKPSGKETDLREYLQGLKEKGDDKQKALVASFIKGNPELQLENENNINGILAHASVTTPKPNSDHSDIIEKQKPHSNFENANVSEHTKTAPSKSKYVIKETSKETHDEVGKKDKQSFNVVHNIVDRAIPEKQSSNVAAHDGVSNPIERDGTQRNRNDERETKPVTTNEMGREQNITETIKISLGEHGDKKPQLVEHEGKHNTAFKGNTEETFVHGDEREEGPETEENGNKATRVGSKTMSPDTLHHDTKVNGERSSNVIKEAIVNKKYTKEPKNEADHKVYTEYNQINNSSEAKESESSTTTVMKTDMTSNGNADMTTKGSTDGNVHRFKHNKNHPATTVVHVTGIVDVPANELNKTKMTEKVSSDTLIHEKVGVDKVQSKKQSDNIHQVTTPEELNAASNHNSNNFVSKSIVHPTVNTVVTSLSTKIITEHSLPVQTSTITEHTKVSSDEKNRKVPMLDSLSGDDDGIVVRQGDKEGPGTSLPCINMRDDRRVYDGAALLWAVIGGAILGGLAVSLLYYCKEKCNKYVNGDYRRVPLEYDFEMNPRLKTS